MLARDLRKILDPFDALTHLECDGFTRVASYALSQAGIEHCTLIGSCRALGTVYAPHFWIEVGDWTVDYRVRMWTSASDRMKLPHGVFKKHAAVQYFGHPVPLLTSPAIFEILTGCKI